MAELIDSSLLIEAERRGLTVQAIWAHLDPGQQYGISAVTASELLVGLHRADTEERAKRRLTYIEAILEHFRVVDFDLACARVHADLGARLRVRGINIGAHDLLIGATAPTKQAAIRTSNVRDFGRIPGLDVRQTSW